MIKDRLVSLFDRHKNQKEDDGLFTYEFCPRCNANLTLQDGYSPELSHWTCRGCGMLLVNPEVPGDSDTFWICDQCGALLNEQTGFTEERREWICSECGFSNKIDPNDIYVSEAEYQASLKDPYRGLSDEAVLELSLYEDIETIGDRPDIVRVRDRETGAEYIRKLLYIYDISVYEYLKTHPISHMPRIVRLYESDNCLIEIEEFIPARTIDEILRDGPLSQEQAIDIAGQLCVILNDLHSLPTPIIHRDIKPSNIMITSDSDVYLLDVNVAKWYDPHQTDDTKHLGTEMYAAPEQVGYGLHASTSKSDVYGLGVLLNVMMTGKFPKEEIPSGHLGDIIKRCISLNADDRYTVKELQAALNEVE